MSSDIEQVHISEHIDPEYAMLASNPDPIRIAMWSGPRSIADLMMRAFGNRFDTAVVDEPFHAAYLRSTGTDHPLRDAILASQPNDWRRVVDQILGPVPDELPIWYQKHMTHHLLPEFGRSWTDQVTNAFLIRSPESVLATYGQQRVEVTLAELGIVTQWELFEAAADRAGQAPPVIDAADIIADPRRSLARLCTALDLPFREQMLTWQTGPRVSDGAWGPHAYRAVEASTGFAKVKHEASLIDLPDHLRALAEMARPYYDKMREFRLS